jgi:Flp pilus assembly protein TadD
MPVKRIILREDRVMCLFKKRSGSSVKENIAKAEEIFLQGAELAKQQKFQEAIAKLTEAISLNPNHAKAHMSLCLSYGATMDLDSARKHYDILKKLDPVLADRVANSPAGMMILRGGSFIQF